MTSTYVFLGAGYLLGARAELATLVAVPLLAGVGALAPDIDHPRSVIGVGLPAALFSTGLLLLAVPFALRQAFARLAPSARLAQPFPQVSSWGWLLLAGAVALGLVSMVSLVLEHRGPTHSIAVGLGSSLVLLVACALLHLPWWYGAVFGWGWITHLAADAATPMGLPYLFWPLGG